MKQILKLAALSLVLFGASCTKNTGSQKSSSISSKSYTNVSRIFNTNGFTILTLQLHRKNGTQNGGAWNERFCDCVYCFGLCRGNRLAAGGDLTPANAIMEDLQDGTGKIYILEAPDSDASTDPTFYVDDDVVISDPAGGSETFTIISGQYPYIDGSGTITFEGNTYNYFGTVTVDFVE